MLEKIKDIKAKFPNPDDFECLDQIRNWKEAKSQFLPCFQNGLVFGTVTSEEYDEVCTVYQKKNPSIYEKILVFFFFSAIKAANNLHQKG